MNNCNKNIINYINSQHSKTKIQRFISKLNNFNKRIKI